MGSYGVWVGECSRVCRVEVSLGSKGVCGLGLKIYWPCDVKNAVGFMGSQAFVWLSECVRDFRSSGFLRAEAP